MWKPPGTIDIHYNTAEIVSATEYVLKKYFPDKFTEEEFEKLQEELDEWLAIQAEGFFY